MSEPRETSRGTAILAVAESERQEKYGQDGRATDEAARLRWSAYWILITLAAGHLTGRILAVDSVELAAVQKRHDQRNDGVDIMRPFLSANDRSRWAHVRALVEHGTHEIDAVIVELNWDTIDKVRHKNADGEYRYYSSKPPLLAVLIAGEYYLLHKITGYTLGDHPYELGRFMLVTLNVIPLIVAWLLLARLVERYGTTNFGRLFVMAAATFGTLLTSFGVTLNNHLPAAVSVIIAVYCTARICLDRETKLRYFILAGLFAAFAAANELPALSFLAAVGVAVLWCDARRFWIAFAPAAGVVLIAFFATNYHAHQSLKPPYMHRSQFSEEDNWYNYPGSYWTAEKKQRLDRGEESVGRYAMHALVGHHGVFSLTPVWLLSFAGMAMLLGKRVASSEWRVASEEQRVGNGEWPVASGDSSVASSLRWFGLGVLALSLVCLAFYILRPLEDRNYGGQSAGFRWMFWFAPLWLLTMLPAADWLSRTRPRRALALVLLGLSVLSVAFPTWNPWTDPWLMQFMEQMGWIEV